MPKPKETHMKDSESSTRKLFIDKLLLKAGWDVNNLTQVIIEFDIPVALPEGVTNPRTPFEGHQFSDYVPLAINTKHLAAITFDRHKANPQFISYSIHSSPYIIKQFESKNRGAIMNGLNLGLIKETKLHKPPIELQNKFAATVEKVEVIKKRYQQSLSELENLYGSLSQRAFKGELDLSNAKITE